MKFYQDSRFNNGDESPTSPQKNQFTSAHDQLNLTSNSQDNLRDNHNVEPIEKSEYSTSEDILGHNSEESKARTRSPMMNELIVSEGQRILHSEPNLPLSDETVLSSSMMATTSSSDKDGGARPGLEYEVSEVCIEHQNLVPDKKPEYSSEKVDRAETTSEGQSWHTLAEESVIGETVMLVNSELDLPTQGLPEHSHSLTTDLISDAMKDSDTDSDCQSLPDVVTGKFALYYIAWLCSNRALCMNIS